MPDTVRRVTEKVIVGVFPLYVLALLVVVHVDYMIALYMIGALVVLYLVTAFICYFYQTFLSTE